MNKLTSILLWIGVFFLVESVCSRTFYVINDQYPNTYESQDPQMQDTEFKRFNNNFYQNQDFAPKRFLKISKVRHLLNFVQCMHHNVIDSAKLCIHPIFNNTSIMWIK